MENPITNDNEKIKLLHKTIICMNKDNISQSSRVIINMFDFNHPYSFNLIISQIIFSVFVTKKDFNIYFDFMKEIESFEETNKVKYKIIYVFKNFLLYKKSRESNFLLYQMVAHNLIELKSFRYETISYFVHYMSEEEISKLPFDYRKLIEEHYEELSKNDWELHKKLSEEGNNSSEIAKIIRNDEIEKLQEISSQENFNFNQTIEPSLYERYSFINQENVTLIDYAAFFGSINCFKFLLMNGSKFNNFTGKYAVAGGNKEIIHLCEQNHSPFAGASEIAIKFHQNDIFHYLYENKIGKINCLEELGRKCISNYNHELLSFLEKEGMEVTNDIINEAAKIGNIYLIKYFLQNKEIPKNIIVFASKSGNIELVDYFLNQKGIKVNTKGRETPLHLAIENGNIEIVKLLLEQKGIDVNLKNMVWLEEEEEDNETPLHEAAKKGNIEIVKSLLEQEGIDINLRVLILIFFAKNILMFYMKFIFIISNIKIIFGNN